ncbi:hypothetical protein RUND412_011190, partial [Rhizina undulata]
AGVFLDEHEEEFAELLDVFKAAGYVADNLGVQYIVGYLGHLVVVNTREYGEEERYVFDNKMLVVDVRAVSDVVCAMGP